MKFLLVIIIILFVVARVFNKRADKEEE